jgi:hypothetical protein
LARPYGVHLNTQWGWDSWERTLSSQSLTLASDPNNSDKIYVGTKEGGSVLKSTNGGYLYSWTLFSPGGSWVDEVRDIEVDWNSHVYAATDEGLMKWDGVSWAKLGGLPTDDITALAIDRFTNPGVVYVGTGGNGVFISPDGGGTWTPFNDGLGNLDITRLAVSASLPKVIYAGTAGGVWSVSLTEVPTPTPTSTQSPTPTSTGTPFFVYLPLVVRHYTPLPATSTPTPTSTPPPGATNTPTPTGTLTSTPVTSPTPTPTSTHTPTETPTPTLTPTATLTPPECSIHGTVTYDGSPPLGIEVHLRFYDGGSWSTVATKLLDIHGRYCFKEVSSLGAGQKYYVRYGPNQNDGPHYLYSWYGPEITSYNASESVPGGDFDIANVDLLSPAHGATVSLPVTFSWEQRGIPGDGYGVGLFDPTSDDEWWTDDLGDVDSVTMTELPQGMVYGKDYGWFMWVFHGSDGYGSSYYYRTITFSASAGEGDAPPFDGESQWSYRN